MALPLICFVGGVTSGQLTVRITVAAAEIVGSPLTAAACVHVLALAPPQCGHAWQTPLGLARPDDQTSQIADS